MLLEYFLNFPAIFFGWGATRLSKNAETEFRIYGKTGPSHASPWTNDAILRVDTLDPSRFFGGTTLKASCCCCCCCCCCCLLGGMGYNFNFPLGCQPQDRGDLFFRNEKNTTYQTRLSQGPNKVAKSWCHIPSLEQTIPLLKINGWKIHFLLGPGPVLKGYVSFRERNTVDGWNPAPVEVHSLSHYLQGFYTSKRWWSPDFWTSNSIMTPVSRSKIKASSPEASIRSIRCNRRCCSPRRCAIFGVADGTWWCIAWWNGPSSCRW